MTKGNKIVQTFSIMMLLLGMAACKKEETATLKNENSSSPCQIWRNKRKLLRQRQNLGATDFSKLEDPGSIHSHPNN